MKRFLMITTASALLCGPAFAQQAAVMPTPSLSATSPLGMVPGAPVGGTGIPFGATEITSPGVSPTPLPSTGIDRQHRVLDHRYGTVNDVRFDEHV